MKGNSLSSQGRMRIDGPNKISTEEVFCQYIRKQTGIVMMDHQLNSLRKTINRGCEKFGFSSWEEYLSALQEVPPTAPEYEFLVAEITIGETYFFRNTGQMEFLRNSWLPRIIRQKRESGDKSLRIWSAGSSSGEEAYSLAIMLHEALGDDPDWNIHLMGTDINPEVLARAVKGRYRNWSFRGVSDQLRNKHFTRSGDLYVIKPWFRSTVHFNYLNLIEDAYPSALSGTHQLDLILCCNVFIYFTWNGGIPQKIMHKFARCLNPDGIIMVGASDLTVANIDGLKFSLEGKVSYYQLPDSTVQPTPPARRVVRSQPDRRADRVDRRLSAQRPVSPRREVPKTAPRVLKPRATSPVEKPRSEPRQYDAITQAFSDGQWQDALPLINDRIAQDGENAMLLHFKAMTLANLGKLEAAAEYCQRSSALDSTDRHSHFLHGIVLAGQGQAREAITALRKALYLDHNFIEAHFQLGLLLLNSGQKDAGLKSLKNALKVAEKSDPNLAVHDAAGMTMGRLVEILRQEISLYSGK